MLDETKVLAAIAVIVTILAAYLATEFMKLQGIVPQLP